MTNARLITAAGSEDCSELQQKKTKRKEECPSPLADLPDDQFAIRLTARVSRTARVSSPINARDTLTRDFAQRQSQIRIRLVWDGGSRIPAALNGATPDAGQIARSGKTGIARTMHAGRLRKASIRDERGISRYHAESSHQQTGRGLRETEAPVTNGAMSGNPPSIHVGLVGATTLWWRPEAAEEEVVKEGCAEVAG